MIFSNCLQTYQNLASLFNLWTHKTIHVNLCKKLRNRSQKEYPVPLRISSRRYSASITFLEGYKNYKFLCVYPYQLTIDEFLTHHDFTRNSYLYQNFWLMFCFDANSASVSVLRFNNSSKIVMTWSYTRQ